jgi:hypothetical protein
VGGPFLFLRGTSYTYGYVGIRKSLWSILLIVFVVLALAQPREAA